MLRAVNAAHTNASNECTYLNTYIIYKYIDTAHIYTYISTLIHAYKLKSSDLCGAHCASQSRCTDAEPATAHKCFDSPSLKHVNIIAHIYTNANVFIYRQRGKEIEYIYIYTCARKGGQTL